MAKYVGPRCRKCRQLGFSVCGSDKCALKERQAPPGMHPQIRRKVSDFKRHLLEKQKLRFSYWITERQFRNYVKAAFKKTGISGQTLMILLERRLDNVVYRIGFAPTILAARQLVSHGHILVNGRKVNIPSYLVNEREEISIREKSRNLPLIEEGLARSAARPSLPYLEVDKANFKGKLTAVPERTQIPLEINEGLIVEHYAKYI